MFKKKRELRRRGRLADLVFLKRGKFGGVENEGKRGIVKLALHELHEELTLG